VWSGLRIAAQPPDKKHPYGHGKAEALATLIVAMILVAAGVSIAVSSVREIMAPQRPPALFTIFVLVGVVAIKETLYQVGRRLSHRSQSGAVLADAVHHRSDAITSIAAFLGITIALVGGPGYEIADGIAALFASGIILYNAGRLARGPLRELMDAESPEVAQRVRRIAGAIAGVKGVEKVLTRKSGTRYLVDMHLEVDPETTVREAHGVAHRVKDAIMAQMPQVQDVLIHVEPYGE
jgi:cation diffusion facilitator family transporter